MHSCKPFCKLNRYTFLAFLSLSLESSTMQERGQMNIPQACHEETMPYQSASASHRRGGRAAGCWESSLCSCIHERIHSSQTVRILFCATPPPPPPPPKPHCLSSSPQERNCFCGCCFALGRKGRVCRKPKQTLWKKYCKLSADDHPPEASLAKI